MTDMTVFLYRRIFGALSGQVGGDPVQVFPNQEAVQGDFRQWVWLAYGLVLLFLAAYSIFLVLQNRAVQGRIRHLEERFDYASTKTSADGGHSD